MALKINLSTPPLHLIAVLAKQDPVFAAHIAKKTAPDIVLSDMEKNLSEQGNYLGVDLSAPGFEKTGLHSYSGAPMTKSELAKYVEESQQELVHLVAPKNFGKALEFLTPAVTQVVSTTTPNVVHKPQLGMTELEALVEEAIDLERRLVEADVEAITKRKIELRKLILGQSENLDATVPWFLKGKTGTIEFSACTKEFVLKDKEKLLKEIGHDMFMAIAKLGITDLKKVLSENELAQFGEYKTTDTRSWKVKPK